MALSLVLNFFLFLLVITSTSACTVCIQKSKATHYYDDAPTSYGGACGYGNSALEISDGYFAAVVPSLYKQGVGCGACYHITCKNKRLCNTIGTNVFVADQSYDNRTDFVVSRKAFSAMARYGKDQELLNSGMVDIEYKRVPCEYENKNLLVRVEESSNNPYYLAIKFLYQGGQTDIVGAQIAQVGSSKWASLKRNYGAVWDTNKVPHGALKLRLTVISGYGKKIILANYVLPADWEIGVVYDSGVQISDIGEEYCTPPSKCYN